MGGRDLPSRTPVFAIALGGAVLAGLIASPATAQEHALSKVRTRPAYIEGEEARAVGIYQKVLPTVVTILTARRVFTQDGAEVEEGVGSGVLISPDGHVLTADHVVEGAHTILVKTHDGVLREAKLLYSEASADIALIQLVDPSPDLAHATLGDSDQLAVGQSIYVIGSPFGLENTFTVGHISGFREFDRLYDGTILAEFIQTDAAINSGNSGGPAFDSRGVVIGIASRILSHSGGSEGLGFVVTINTAKQILNLEDRAWMGIEAIYLDAQDLRRLFHLDRQGGLLIQRVASGSGGEIPAIIVDREMLLGGDLILEFNHQQACHGECLIREGKKLGGQDHVPITFLRDGDVMQVVVDVSATRRNFLLAP